MSKVKFKMRKIKSHLRWCKKFLEKYYNVKIYGLSFPRAQLKLMFDFIQEEKRISKIINYYYINKIKIKK